MSTETAKRTIRTLHAMSETTDDPAEARELVNYARMVASRYQSDGVAEILEILDGIDTGGEALEGIPEGVHPDMAERYLELRQAETSASSARELLAALSRELMALRGLEGPGVLRRIAFVQALGEAFDDLAADEIKAEGDREIGEAVDRYTDELEEKEEAAADAKAAARKADKPMRIIGDYWQGRAAGKIGERMDVDRETFETLVLEVQDLRRELGKRSGPMPVDRMLVALHLIEDDAREKRTAILQHLIGQTSWLTAVVNRSGILRGPVELELAGQVAKIRELLELDPAHFRHATESDDGEEADADDQG